MAAIHFDDVKKQNLISTLFALECVVDGIKTFVDDKFNTFHAKLQGQLLHLNQPCVSSVVCSKLPKSAAWCPTCSGWKTAILSSHKNRAVMGRYGTDWSNVDSSKWPTDPTEVQKCFLPKWCNQITGSGPNVNDISVILDKMINCDDVRQIFVSTIDPGKIKEIRNKVHHGVEITSIEKETFCQDMMDFLKIPDVWAYPEAQTAYNTIKIFKEKSYMDIIREKIIEDHELRKLRDRISLNWGRCYKVSLASIAMMTIIIVLPLLYVGTIEIVKYPYFSEIFHIIIGIFYPSTITETISCNNVTVVTRQGWGGKLPKNTQIMQTPVDIVLVHHTAGHHCTNKPECAYIVRIIQHFHMDGINWDDVGYNFLIGEDGRIYEARGWNRVGAHTKGWNDKSVSFAFIGNFNDRKPNSAALEALQQIISCGIREGKIDKDYSLFGHRDKRPTDSPGHSLYDELKNFDHFHYKMN